MPDERALENLHGFYLVRTNAIYRKIGDANFAPQVDKLCQDLCLGLWQGQALTEAHRTAYNALYSKGRPEPSTLYWELVSESAKFPGFTVPDFFRALVVTRKDAAEQLLGFLRELMRRLSDPNLAIPAETAFYSEASQLLESVLKSDHPMAFSAGRTEKPADSASAKPRLYDPTADLSRLMDEVNNLMGPKSPVQTAAPQTPAPEEAPAEEPPENLDDLLAELDSLVGLGQIKKDVRSLINLIKVRKLRESQGLAVAEMSLHMVFTGNPGTGKTTVARLLARLYRSIGVLEKGTLLEVDRSGLVAGYVGQTALKTMEAVKKAQGGILFVDEAYSLVPDGSGNDFGQEAISTILKAMEDMREDLVVIVAGYPEPMERFISSNPGLESRFGKYFQFEDYDGDELMDIFRMQCKKNQYTPDEETEQFCIQMFKDLYDQRDENFGNARDVRNIFERAIANQANRLAGMENPTKDDLMRLTKADIVGEPDAEEAAPDAEKTE